MMRPEVLPGILKGVRVLEICDGAAASIACLQLAEAGAEVIRIEPAAGSMERDGAAFAVRNRGKLSLVLDLENPDQQARLQTLLASSDVLIHDRTPEAAAASGLDHAALSALHPHLIVSAVTGWPGNHPDAERSNRETLVLARLGLLSEQPGHRPGPVFLRMPFATHCAAWLCAIGVIARLIQRHRGKGVGPADTSLAQGALIPMTMHWASAQTPSPSFAKGLDKSIAIAIHRCSDDRWIHVHYSPDNAPLMKAALEAMGAEAIALANARAGKNHSAPNFGANREIFATRPSKEWLEHLWAHDVAAQPAAEFGDIYFDAQARENGYVVEVDDPVFGPTLQPGPAYSVTPEPVVARDGLRSLGADTEAILSRIPEPRRSQPRATALPLDGVRILDFGAYLAGPFGTMLLADLGADVIKIEPPAGDFMRYLDRVFCGCQRGKRSIAVQLKESAAKPVLHALVEWADAFHHNMRAPSARKLGLDYQSLKRIRPDIVGCHVSSYGPLGARADWPGYDQMFQAACGWEVEDGGQDNPPLWLRFGVCDHFAALASAFALLLALYHRDHTGEGQMTSASLLGGTILSTAETIVHADGSMEPFERLNHEQTGVSPTHRLYRCRNGWIAVCAVTPQEGAAFYEAIGGDPETAIASRDVVEVEQVLSRAGAPCEIVREDQGEPFLRSEANRAAGLVFRGAHAVQGELVQVGAFWTLGGTPLAQARTAPALGQHTREILGCLGRTAPEIEALQIAGVVAA